jgi:hypothetical protein
MMLGPNPLALLLGRSAAHALSVFVAFAWSHQLPAVHIAVT